MDFRTIQMLDNLWHILIMCHYIIVVSWDQELHFHAYLNSRNLYLWMSCGQKSRNNSERYTETMNMKWTLQMLICKHNMPIYLTWVSWFNESRGVTSIGFRLHHHPGVPVGARARPITVLRMKASKIPGCRTFKNNNWNLDELWEFSELWGTGWVSLVLFEGPPSCQWLHKSTSSRMTFRYYHKKTTAPNSHKCPPWQENLHFPSNFLHLEVSISGGTPKLSIYRWDFPL